ncbi:GldG family protein [Patescibacteria group bacterium]|nr:GldG family protein [Patescibacteria group bacterium]MCG2702671.1 GldG family protein [Candidatus Parcubacteria bacterium]MBU4264880.1 GldG family protein [Patescibacteria group bacterium]MBU4389751.1 GldG family protein [Patescibacteria group bacterium]MBU4397592.1 GldG family protein [Patescibacteria group bacterium]
MKRILVYLTNINLIISIIVINLIVIAFPQFKLDLTKNKIHTLSPSTKKIIKDLDDVVNVKVYLTQQLPPEVEPLSQSLKTILKEFSGLNSSNFVVKYIDPSKDDDIKTEAIRAGIQPLQFSSVKGDKFEISNGFFGLTLNYADQKETLPVASDIGNIEYFLVSTIKKMASKQVPTLLLSSGYGEIDSSEIQILTKYLSQIYQLETVDLSDTENQLNDSATTLLMLGPKEELNQEAIEKITKWVEQKKGFILLTDKFDINTNLQSSLIENIGIENLLNKNGIKLENKLVLDESSSIANFQGPTGPFLTRYPYWIKILPENFNADIPAVSGLNSLLLYWASPLTVSSPAQSLFTSSQYSWLVDENADLSPAKQEKISDSELKVSTLAAVNLKDAKIAVIGDTDFIKDQFITNDQSNLAVLMNLIDYFSSDESLLSIRSKTLDPAPIIPLKDEFKQLIKWVNIAIPPISLIIVFFLSSFIRHQRNKKFV